MTDIARLEPFFSPGHIALAGASERRIYPEGILNNLLDCGYQGDIYPVNPKRKTVFGLTCFPGPKQTPQRPDLAILDAPRQYVLPALCQNIDLDIPATLEITARFSEADAGGKQPQAVIVDPLVGAPLDRPHTPRRNWQRASRFSSLAIWSRNMWEPANDRCR